MVVFKPNKKLNKDTKQSKTILKELELIERKGWLNLYKSKNDGSYWRIDEADKYQTRFLVRINSLNDWYNLNTVHMEKRLLLNNRGGTEEELCQWQGCNQKALKGCALCVDHIYDMGVRE